MRLNRFKISGLLLILCFLMGPNAFSEDIRITPVVKAIQKASPAIVNIGTERLVLLRQQHPVWGNYGNDLDQLINTLQQSVPPTVGTLKTKSLGSGVVVSKDGLIITNAHVIHMASKVFVNFQNGDTYEAKVLGTNVKDDLALLKINDVKDFPYLNLTKDIIIGETVVSIGNPYGLQSSVSSGIVSGIGRTLTVNPANLTFTDLIQTDASINLGSSGGALVDLNGDLIGINMAMMQGAENIAFAIPAEKVKRLLEEYEKVRNQPAGAQTPAA